MTLPVTPSQTVGPFFSIGLTWEDGAFVVPDGTAVEAALALAERITVNAPLAVWASKRVAMGVDDGVITGDEPGWARTMREIGTLIRSKDGKEGPLAFAEKRQPVWKAK